MVHNQVSHKRVGPHALPGRLPEGRRVLDTAVGILVAVHRCGVAAAFQQVIAAAQRHNVSVFEIASALVALVSGDAPEASSTAGACAAEREWGDLFTVAGAPELT